MRNTNNTHDVMNLSLIYESRQTGSILIEKTKRLSFDDQMFVLEQIWNQLDVNKQQELIDEGLFNKIGDGLKKGWDSVRNTASDALGTASNAGGLWGGLAGAAGNLMKPGATHSWKDALSNATSGALQGAIPGMSSSNGGIGSMISGALGNIMGGDHVTASSSGAGVNPAAGQIADPAAAKANAANTSTLPPMDPGAISTYISTLLSKMDPVKMQQIVPQIVQLIQGEPNQSVQA